VTSYTSSISGYEQNQWNLFNSGSLYLDPQRNRLLAVTPLCSGDPQAVIHFPASGTCHSAKNAVMPIYPAINRLHHWYIDSTSGLVPLADAAGLVVQPPVAKGDPYWVYSGGARLENLCFAFDPSAVSGQRIIR
jgi:hypothetical protein